MPIVHFVDRFTFKQLENSLVDGVGIIGIRDDRQRSLSLGFSVPHPCGCIDDTIKRSLETSETAAPTSTPDV
jgi:hypothetical protein